MILRWLIFLVIYVLLTWYAFQAVKTVTKNVWVYYAYFFVSVLVLGNFVYQLAFTEGTSIITPARSYAFGFLLSFLALQLTTIIFLFGEDIVRFFTGIYNKFFGVSQSFNVPSRRKFISTIALSVAAVPFLSLLYGMYKGKYNFRVLKYVLEFNDLPAAFDGYKITQISDVHSGSFHNRKKVAYAVDLINEQASDVILFTGDLVNNVADEMLPWKDLFGKLTAKDGMYSVLGNHDYGDYASWESEVAKAENLEKLKTIQKEMGFDLLLNESRYLEKEGDKIALVGVENWGAGGFKKAGDLKKASKNIKKDDFKILMSHDPSHWEKQVIADEYHYHLTLSGHTHGMQFGIEIPRWIKWSPVKWRYKYWAGIYKEMGQYINVNRGLGYIGYPGRVGIFPEITVIELKKSVKSV